MNRKVQRTNLRGSVWIMREHCKDEKDGKIASGPDEPRCYFVAEEHWPLSLEDQINDR